MTDAGKRDLLVLGCSQKKRPHQGRAIDVYDGPLFRTVRHRLSEIDKPLDILILSARYGIIRQTDIIEPYDDKLPVSDISGFGNKVAIELTKLLPTTLNSVLILAPRQYIALLPLDVIRKRSTHFETFSGRMGMCQARLLGWFGIKHHAQPRTPTSLGPLSAHSAPIEASQIQQESQRLAAKDITANRVTQWYALVGDQHVPVKRLVAALTGTPVSSFETCHALALLHRNGVETCRVGA